MSSHYSSLNKLFIEGNLEVKFLTILTEKQRRAEAERRERLEKRTLEEKESEERRYKYAKWLENYEKLYFSNNLRFRRVEK